MAHEPDFAPPGRTSETVFYPGPGIVVTSRRIDTDGERFLVRDLERFQRIYEYAHPARSIALICGGLELALAVALAVVYGAIFLIGSGFVIAAGLALAVLFDSRHNPSWMILLAVHHGRVVKLYSTDDRRQFERVRLAVLRAAEANERPKWRPGTDVMVPGVVRVRYGSSPARRRRYVRRSVDRP